MLAYALQRTVLLIPTFVGITFIAFLVMRLAPGDPVDLYFAGGLGAAEGAGVSPEKLADVQRAKEEMRRSLGLDRPLPVQYGIWLRRLATLDLGTSFKDRRPVWEKIRERLPCGRTPGSTQRRARPPSCSTRCRRSGSEP